MYQKVYQNGYFILIQNDLKSVIFVYKVLIIKFLKRVFKINQDYRKTKKVIPTGLEPVTYYLEGSCSIH